MKALRIWQAVMCLAVIGAGVFSGLCCHSWLSRDLPGVAIWGAALVAFVVLAFCARLEARDARLRLYR